MRCSYVKCCKYLFGFRLWRDLWENKKRMFFEAIFCSLSSFRSDIYPLFYSVTGNKFSKFLFSGVKVHLLGFTFCGIRKNEYLEV